MSKTVTVPTRLLNTPLMAAEQEINTIISAVSGNLSIDVVKKMLLQADQDPITQIRENIAVITIAGGITFRGYGWDWDVTYNEIRQGFQEALADPKVDAIVFDIDSPGGEVAGCFDLCDEIYNARGQKPIYAIANERCFSAAYAIASAADKIYLTRTAAVGSIGILAVHADQSKLNEKIGITYTPIFAGERKNDLSPHHPICDKALSAVQQRVNHTYALLCEIVARNRGMTVDAIKNTQAGVYEGSTAVEKGLADAVMPFTQALTHISTITTSTQGEKIMSLEQIIAGLSAALSDETQKEETIKNLASIGFVPATAQAQPEATQSAVTKPAEIEPTATAQAIETARNEGVAHGEQETKKNILEIIDTCQLADMPQMASDLIKKNVSAKEAKTIATNAHAAQSSGWRINAATSPTDTGGENPLIADAKQRAEA